MDSPWKNWRKRNPQLKPDLRGVKIVNCAFIGFDFRGVDLSEAKFTSVDVAHSNFSGATLCGADLSYHDLSTVDFKGANLYRAKLKGTLLKVMQVLRQSGIKELERYTKFSQRFRGAYLSEADLSEVDLSMVDLHGMNLARANLSRSNLSMVNLKGANLRMANLSEANLSKADLTGANISEAKLIETDLTEAILCESWLVGSFLTRATITDAWLLETQRRGWCIEGIVCEAVYWDKDRQERTTYSPGEFERLYADKTKIVLHYEGGLSPIEIATLPALIQRLEANHPGCVLRLQSVQEAPGGATVTLVVDDGGGRNPDELKVLKADIEIVSQRAIRVQRALLEERGRREQADLKLQMMYDEIFPRMMRLIMEKSPGIQITGGTIYGNVVGEVSGENAQVNYTHNDLATIEALIREMSAHHAELPLTSAERTQFEEKLKAIQEQLAAQVPNHPLLREALHSVRHILEAGVAHVLVGQWLPLLHKIG
jgi:uncharacterized protein YjbI with pentapeptide repeats